MNAYTFFGAVVLFAAVLAAGPSAGLAADAAVRTLATQTERMDSLASANQGAVSSRISSDFSTFAGSTANSDALVTGLRNGTAVTLTSTDAKGVTTSTTFTPPTGKMGYGNVYTSLALAKQQLANAGITEPTAQQLEAALVGGTVTSPSGQTTTLTGVLELRAQGMGWGQIAQQYGYKLGPVISGMRSSNASVAAQAARETTSTTTTTSNVTNAAGNKSGIVTGAGTTANGQGHAYGRGIVSGAGSMAGQAGATSGGHGKAIGKGH